MERSHAGIQITLALGMFWLVRPVCASTPREESASQAFFKWDGLMDGPALAFQLKRTFMNEAEWREQVLSIKSRFQDWEKGAKGDMGQFLNDQLIGVALGAAGGEVEKIQKGIAWLALYKEFKQEAHPLIAKFLREHRTSVSSLLSQFTWDRTALYIKNKEWRKDLSRNGPAAASGPGVNAAPPAGAAPQVPAAAKKESVAAMPVHPVPATEPAKPRANNAQAPSAAAPAPTLASAGTAPFFNVPAAAWNRFSSPDTIQRDDLGPRRAETPISGE